MEFQLVLSLMLSGFLLYVVFISSGVFARMNPRVFFIFGIFIAISGVLIIASVDQFVRLLGFAPIKEKIPNLDEIAQYAEFTKKAIETGFAAVGAGLIALSMDIRSEAILEEQREIFAMDLKRYEHEDAKRKVAREPVTEEERNRRTDNLIGLQEWKHNIEKERKRLYGKMARFQSKDI